MAKQRLRDYDPDRFWGRAYVSTILTGMALFFSWRGVAGAVSLRTPSIAWLWTLSPLYAPFLGILLHDLAASLAGRATGGLFWARSGKTAPAHSEGESLLQRGHPVEAADWFARRAMEDPEDWRAQRRLVEICAGPLGDRERTVEERGRLLRHPGIPTPEWMEAALAQARSWEEAGRPDRAVSAYKSLIWKVPDGEDAEEARRRIRVLEKSPPIPEGDPGRS